MSITKLHVRRVEDALQSGSKFLSLQFGRIKMRELTMDEILAVAGGADADRQAPNDGSRGDSAAELAREPYLYN